MLSFTPTISAFFLSAALLLATASTSLRAQPAAVAPTATIKPSAPSATTAPDCRLTLSNPEIEFGRINLYEAQHNDAAYRQGAAGGASIGKQIRMLRVSCSVPSRFALRFRAPADASNLAYGMGRRGSMWLRLAHAQADGKPALLTANPAPVRSPQNPLEQLALAPQQSVQAVLHGQIGEVSNFTVQVEVEGKMDVRTQRLRSNRDFAAEGIFELELL